MTGWVSECVSQWVSEGVVKPVNDKQANDDQVTESASESVSESVDELVSKKHENIFTVDKTYFALIAHMLLYEINAVKKFRLIANIKRTNYNLE